MDWLNDIGTFAKQQMLEIVLSLVATIITVYVVPWIKEKTNKEFADRVDSVLNKAVQAAVNKVAGTAPGIPIPQAKLPEVVTEVRRVITEGAPVIADKIGATLKDKVLARLEIADPVAGNTVIPRAAVMDALPASQG